MGDTTNYESFYQGGYSSLNPDYGNFTGYHFDPAQLGSPTGIQTANQLNEVVARIKEGVKNVELQPIQEDVTDQIPKEHFKEIAGLMKLSGVKPSFHMEMVDAAGFGKQGYGGEMAQKDSENRMMAVLEKAQQLDPEGNVPVVIHSSAGVPGTEWRPGDVKKGEPRFKEHTIALINQENPQQIIGAKEDRKYSPRSKPEEFEAGKDDIEKGGTLMTARQAVESTNANTWEEKLTGLAFYKKHADEIIGNSPAILAEDLGKTFNQENFNKLTPEQQQAALKLGDANIFLENVRMNFSGAFDKAYRYGTNQQRKELRELSEEYQKDLKDGNGKIGQPLILDKTLNKAISELKKITTLREYKKTGKVDPNYGPPEIFVSVEEFAMKKAAETFGNVAARSYEKFGEHAPLIAIENMMQGRVFSRAEDMKGLIEKSKQQFVDRATASKDKGGLGMSRGVAEKQADKMIGMTLDVGHLNMIRKAGFGEKDVIREAEKMAPLVKHVHLTDNFGYSDSHLPPGMGNVPTKEILEKLEKAGALKNARAIVEAGAFAVGFKKSPMPYALQALGSPIYGAKMAPYWNQVADIRGNYFGFPLAQLPEKHFSTYGSGFSSLPEELGGQVPGTQSRFSGTSNA